MLKTLVNWTIKSFDEYAEQFVFLFFSMIADSQVSAHRPEVESSVI